MSEIHPQPTFGANLKNSGKRDTAQRLLQDTPDQRIFTRRSV
jgi:hypothetical protein